MSKGIVALALALVMCLTWPAGAQQSTAPPEAKPTPSAAHKIKHHRSAPEQPAAVTSSGSEVSQVEVAYANGVLTVNAEDAPLRDVLNAICARTGARVSGSVSLTRKVVAHIGPAPTNKAIADLLDQSGVDYAILGSKNDPSSVTTIVLMEPAKQQPEAVATSSAGTTSEGTAHSQSQDAVAQSEPKARDERGREEGDNGSADRDNSSSSSSSPQPASPAPTEAPATPKPPDPDHLM